jgi:anti-sigma factor RsiW
MKCGQAKSLFSSYLDGAVTGTQMGALSRHLQDCGRCRGEYVSLRQTQQLLAKAGRRKAPADLALKLRVAISHEVAQSKRPFLGGLLIRLENALNAGLATAVLVFGLIMGSTALPLGYGDDVPLALHTAPQLQQSAFGTTLGSINEESLVIEAYVDSNGRVQDYRIISNSMEDKELPPQVKNMLIFTTFRPATSMGRPTSGRAVLSFSKISVRG